MKLLSTEQTTIEEKKKDKIEIKNFNARPLQQQVYQSFKVYSEITPRPRLLRVQSLWPTNINLFIVNFISSLGPLKPVWAQSVDLPQ